MKTNRGRVRRRRRKGVWSIVLAGGNGERTRDFIERHLGETKPKQFCTFVGTRSLLQHTVDRADALAAPAHRLVVVAREHIREASEQLDGRGGRLLEQPRNRGTAPGVFFPLTHVLARDPEATVVIYPSDHFVHPESAFVRAVSRAFSRIERVQERVLLLGVRPESSATDYGWIVPGTAIPEAGARGLLNVAGFVEKPTPEVAERMVRSGGLWSTMIVIAKLRALWGLGWRFLPRMMPLFVELWDSVGRESEERVLDRIYRQMPVADLSRDLIQQASKHLAVMELDDLSWSDWGHPSRITETLARLDTEPVYASRLERRERSKGTERLRRRNRVVVAHA